MFDCRPCAVNELFAKIYKYSCHLSIYMHIRTHIWISQTSYLSLSIKLKTSAQNTIQLIQLTLSASPYVNVTCNTSRLSSSSVNKRASGASLVVFGSIKSVSVLKSVEYSAGVHIFPAVVGNRAKAPVIVRLAVQRILAITISCVFFYFLPPNHFANPFLFLKKKQ